MENIDYLIKTLKELNLVLNQENYFLEKNNLQEVTNLYSQKEILTKELRKISDLDSFSLASFNDLDSDKKNELNLMINSFEGLKDQNSSLLNKAIEKNKILVDEIKNELLKLDIKDFNYFKELNKNTEPYIINEKV
jgi:hypothetical protein